MSWAETIAAITGSAVTGSKRLSGGSLGGATRLDLADGRVIVAKQGGDVPVESAMLAALAEAGAPVPEVLHCADDLLLMAFVESEGGAGDGGWQDLARVLAKLHAPREEPYGWDADYHFAEVAIANARSDNWSTFWGEHRIACHAKYLGPVTAARLEALAGRMGDILPATPPASLLHGDLWGGNILFAKGRVAALIDPACYIGHREVDIAMLTLFDHPPEEFFEGCELEEGWRERLPAYRLWPLLVHLRLFGESYRAPVERALDALGA
ncbi:fructosamine kinase family protein [Alteraurantiacibacter aquimixticola]|uniref:Aminoglycoside phosphotransferase n=1 Tax=Alteraurantiacibacter aquimixticola TaxID=2489173 RepID=A0A4T3EYF9_9SPHN|nr:fructosamine kinase family protein [Alteraurantiacibacter aquimixticola]TIX49688.1 aminoglycoside phosphotransferase [Alteraurantiacibacter aquimixticola]